MGVSVNCLIMVLLAVLGSGAAAAQEETRYQDHRALSQHLRSLANQHPELVSIDVLGESPEGREVWLITMGAGETSSHPALLVAGGVEGDDLAGGEICLRLIERLLRDYGAVDSVSRLLENSTFYIVPRLNPDAAECLLRAPRYARDVNGRSVDEDRDGLTDEDGPDDVNGDGIITQMRVEDPEGSWLRDPDDPQLLRQADIPAGERGQYRLLCEGVDNDKDGSFNEDGAGGVDLNANFSTAHAPFDPRSGPYPLSETETRGFADFCFSHANIAAVFTFSRQSNLLTPWESEEAGVDEEQWIPRHKVLAGDAPYLQRLRDSYARITSLEKGPDAEKGAGALSEWAYYHFGRWSVSVPAWWPRADDDGEKSADPEKKDPIARMRRDLHGLEKMGAADAFLEWQRVPHPDFQDAVVEIGGFRPGVTVNPPADSLSAVADRHIAFLLHLGMSLPRLDIAEVDVDALDDRLYRITLVLANRGYLPGNTRVGARLPWAPGVAVSIALDRDQRLVSGRMIHIVDILEDSAKISWIVSTPRGRPVTLTAGSPMTGYVERTVELR